MMEEKWKAGQIDIGTVTPESCAYVAGYAMKKWYGRGKTAYEVVNKETGEVTSERRPEFCVMSKGIGRDFMERYAGEIFERGSVMLDGRPRSIPRYYMRKFAETDPLEAEQVKHRIYLRAMQQREDNTPERLAIREEYQQRQHDFFAERKDI